MKKNNRYIASLILLIVTAGFLLTLPLRASFAGGLLSALFASSMIGGFADWFGVAALTRKPLGIPFKTEIVPRNREKLLESMAYMVEQELITKEAIIQKLEHFSISASLIDYLDNQGGKEDITQLANRLAQDMLSGIDLKDAGEYLRRLLKDNTGDIRLAPLVSEALEWLAVNLADERLVGRIADELKEFLLYPQFGQLVGNVADNIYRNISRNADKETLGKKLFFRLAIAIADYSQVSPAKLSSRLITEGLEYFSAIKDPQSVQRKGLENWLKKTSDDLLENRELQNKIEQKGRELLEHKGSGAALADRLYPFIMEGGILHRSGNTVSGLIDKLVGDFKNDPAQQVALDKYIRNALSKLLDENHAVIGQLVRKKLGSFTDEMLVDLVENKAGNDLQMIRINGSIVGGLTGVVLFLISHIAGVMIGG